MIKFIAAGEKINDIETAIRELIDNSVDAGAKTIEVRLARFGVDGIEVVDDGVGIEEESFKHLGVRYHTSKIADFSKFQETLTTFGFRGEALSCLVSIANITITTKTKASPTGTKLVFGKDGSLTKSEPFARTVGTTVIVKNLFHSLPVRRRELETTAKKQYDRVVKLMYEHLLARPHIKFILSKKTNTKKEKDFAHGGTTLEGCIISIFGIKVLDSLEQFHQPWVRGVSSLESCENSDSKDAKISQDKEHDGFFKNKRKSIFKREKPEFLFQGYISKIGSGRNSADCQFIFINKKPCDIPQVTKLINEIYRNYSPNQYPFYVLYIQVQTWAVDFNVPRKRVVILQEENRLCNMIREVLNTMYSLTVQSDHKSVPAAHIPVASQLKNKTTDIQQTSKRGLDAVTSEDVGLEPAKKQPSKDPDSPATAKATMTESSDLNDPMEDVSPTEVTSENDRVSVSSQSVYPISRKSTASESASETEGATPDRQAHPSRYFDEPRLENGPIASTSRESVGFQTALECLQKEQYVEENPILTVQVYDARYSSEPKFKQIEQSDDSGTKVFIEHLEDLDLAMERERKQRQPHVDEKEFSFAIHPNFNVVAEQELKFHLDRTSFESMQIIGQFNRGFIIARLNKHLFIIDQHATDERANYESQLDKYPLVKQPMVVPKPLYLNSIQEHTVINNLEEFRSRGFEFLIDETKIAGMRVLLASTSICKGQGLEDQYLTKDDVEELIDVIANSPNNLATYTLKKVRYVAASRACRGSVMIGDKLNWSQMKEIVSKMSTLQNPWVCAHNRPTIRHLMDTDWVSD